jgi:hypothetical protein
MAAAVDEGSPDPFDGLFRPPPQEIAGSRVPQISLRNRLEAERCIEISRKLVGESLVLEEAVVASRSNGLLVQTSIDRFIRPICSGAMYASVPAMASVDPGAWHSHGR